MAWGDAIQIDVTLDRPMRVWMVNEDDRGNAYLLYPADAHRSPILDPERVHRLTTDPSGTTTGLSISDDATVETILVIASTDDVPRLADILDDLPQPGEQLGTTRRLVRRMAPSTNADGTIAHLLSLPELQNRGPGMWHESLYLVHASSR